MVRKRGEPTTRVIGVRMFDHSKLSLSHGIRRLLSLGDAVPEYGVMESSTHRGRVLRTSRCSIVLSSVFGAFTRVFHLSAKVLDLLTDDSPEQEVIKLMTLFSSLW